MSDPVVCSGEGALGAWVALSRVDGLLADRLDDALRAEHGLTLAEHEVMVQVAASGGLMQMGEVARSIVVSKSGATRLVAKLEEQRLIERVVFPDDRRATFARLTRRGERLLSASTGVFERVLDEGFGSVLDPDEIAELQRILGKVLGAHGWVPPGPCARAAEGARAAVAPS